VASDRCSCPALRAYAGHTFQTRGPAIIMCSVEGCAGEEGPKL
jgi:hypothetical protein